MEGVLTKADLVTKGEEAKWFDVFRNKTFPIEHNYYVTRQPTTHQRQSGMTWDERRAQETAFFNDHSSIWRNEDRNRQGTEKLVAALSNRLSIMISKRYTLYYFTFDSSIPKLQETLRRYLRNVEHEQLRVPPPVPPAAAQYTVYMLCNDFIGMIEEKTKPNPEVIRKAFQEMAKNLIGTHPVFDVRENSDKYFSFLTFHDDGGEPGDLEHIRVNQGKSPISVVD